MNFKVMCRLNSQGVWYVREFDDEKQAAEFAREQEGVGAASVEAYKKVRDGYRKIKL